MVHSARSGATPSRGQPLAGRVVLVTGGGTGIGRSVAEAAADAGADIAIAWLDSSDEAAKVLASIQSSGRQARGWQVDVTDRAQNRKLVEEVVACFGRIDGLVNNAGIMPSTPFLEITEEEWELVVRTDLTAMFFLSQAVIPHMLTQGGGAIVNVASRLAQIGWGDVAHYAAAKAGAIALAKSISRAFGQQGVRANAVAPGVTNTRMGRGVMEGEVGRRRMLELPLGRFGQPAEVAEAVIFLLSDASSLFLGQTLGPNSGGLMA